MKLYSEEENEIAGNFEPDLIVGLGGGSAMDAAKAMWIFYEHPELTQMEDILPPNEFPKLRGKARMCCIPSTSGTASEVSRSIVISDNEKGLKHGVGNMEMMPDIAICDPEVTMSMPAKITAETGNGCAYPCTGSTCFKTVQIICQIFLQARQPGYYGNFTDCI